LFFPYIEYSEQFLLLVTPPTFLNGFCPLLIHFHHDIGEDNLCHY
jgi:hypothetical protein